MEGSVCRPPASSWLCEHSWESKSTHAPGVSIRCCFCSPYTLCARLVEPSLGIWCHGWRVSFLRRWIRETAESIVQPDWPSVHCSMISYRCVAGEPNINAGHSILWSESVMSILFMSSEGWLLRNLLTGRLAVPLAFPSFAHRIRNEHRRYSVVRQPQLPPLFFLLFNCWNQKRKSLKSKRSRCGPTQRGTVVA